MLFRCASVGFDFWLSIHNFFAVLSIKFSMLGAQFAISAFYASLHMRTVEKLFTYNSLKFVIDFPQCWQLMQYHVSSGDFAQTQIEFSTRKAPKFTIFPVEIKQKFIHELLYFFRHFLFFILAGARNI